MKKYLFLVLLLSGVELIQAQEKAAGPIVKQKWHFGHAQDTTYLRRKRNWRWNW